MVIPEPLSFIYIVYILKHITVMNAKKTLIVTYLCICSTNNAYLVTLDFAWLGVCETAFIYISRSVIDPCYK